MVTVGTSYFVSKITAVRYYAHERATLEDIDVKIKEGLIHVGEPPIKAGEHIVLVDNGMRYAIVESGR